MDKRDIPIAAPCTLDWRRMTPADGGRFCGDCKKVVRDLSSLSEREARAMLKQPAAKELCIRYLHDRDGKIFFAGDMSPARGQLLPASLLSKTKRAAMLAAAVAVPLAVQACSLPTSSSSLSSDSTTSSDGDGGLIESMGGAPYEPDDAAPQPLDASDGGPSVDEDAGDAAPPPFDDAASDASPDGSSL